MASLPINLKDLALELIFTLCPSVTHSSLLLSSFSLYPAFNLGSRQQLLELPVFKPARFLGPGMAGAQTSLKAQQKRELPL